MTNNTPALLQKDITDQVNGKLKQLQTDGLVIPPDYSAENALKSAFFKLQDVKSRDKKPALDVCTKESIANSLLDMVTQGLSPAKTQCYFVVYGDKLQLLRSYFGTQAVLKRLSRVVDVWANVIYQDDVFDYEIADGRERLIKHETKFENRDKPILGAYAVIKTLDDEILTVMTKKEIDKSWSKAQTKNVQNDFPQEMSKRTVINRAAKSFINTSNDSDLLIDAVNRSTANEYDDTSSRKEAEIVEEIENEANTEEFITEPEIIEQNETSEVQESVSSKTSQPDFLEDEGDPF